MQRNKTRAGDRLWFQFERSSLQLWRESAKRYLWILKSHHQWCYREADGGQGTARRQCSSGRTRKRKAVKATIHLREVSLLSGLLDVLWVCGGMGSTRLVHSLGILLCGSVLTVVYGLVSYVQCSLRFNSATCEMKNMEFDNLTNNKG